MGTEPGGRKLEDLRLYRHEEESGHAVWYFSGLVGQVEPLAVEGALEGGPGGAEAAATALRPILLSLGYDWDGDFTVVL